MWLKSRTDAIMAPVNRWLQSCGGEHGLTNEGRLWPGQALPALLLPAVAVLQLFRLGSVCGRWWSRRGEGQQRSFWHHRPPAVYSVCAAWHPRPLGQQVKHTATTLNRIKANINAETRMTLIYKWGVHRYIDLLYFGWSVIKSGCPHILKKSYIRVSKIKSLKCLCKLALNC